MVNISKLINSRSLQTEEFLSSFHIILPFWLQNSQSIYAILPLSCPLAVSFLPFFKLKNIAAQIKKFIKISRIKFVETVIQQSKITFFFLIENNCNIIHYQNLRKLKMSFGFILKKKVLLTEMCIMIYINSVSIVCLTLWILIMVKKFFARVTLIGCKMTFNNKN